MRRLYWINVSGSRRQEGGDGSAGSDIGAATVVLIKNRLDLLSQNSSDFTMADGGDSWEDLTEEQLDDQVAVFVKAKAEADEAAAAAAAAAAAEQATEQAAAATRYAGTTISLPTLPLFLPPPPCYCCK